MDNIASAGWFVVVAALWGATNPFIKMGSKGIEDIRESRQDQAVPGRVMVPSQQLEGEQITSFCAPGLKGPPVSSSN